MGNTGLRCTKLGLGGGGPARLGLRRDGRTPEAERHAEDLIHLAIDLGITLIDTAESYPTEDAIGRAVAGRRDELVLCTKKSIVDHDNSYVTPDAFAAGIDASLRRLGTDHVDVFFVHGIMPGEEYERALDTAVPVMERAKRDGKVRAIGVTEFFQGDPDHTMLSRALDDGWPEVVMVGFSILNQTARESILPRTRAGGVGTLGMFAARRALTVPDKLIEEVGGLIQRGEISARDVDPTDPLGFIGGSADITDAAYRFCLQEPELDTVLFGTSSFDHMRANVETAMKGPLDPDLHARLVELFGKARGAVGN